MNSTSRTSQRPALRRVVLYLVIGSFGLAALMGIVALLSGGAFGETEGKVLLTTLATGLASLAVLACFSTLDSRFQPVGAVGAASALVPLGIALYLIWNDWGTGYPSEGLMQAFGITITIAVTLAQVSLLLATAGDTPRLRALLWGTVVLAGLMALVVIALIMEWINGDEQWRWIGVLAILDVLGTIVTMALAKFGGRRAEEPTRHGFLLPAELDEAVTARAAETGTSPQRFVEDAVRRQLAR